MTPFKQTVTHTFQFDDYTIEVMNMREGFAWYEYRITLGGAILIEIEDQYGMAVVAASDALRWIADHGEPPASLTNEQIHRCWAMSH